MTVFQILIVIVLIVEIIRVIITIRAYRAAEAERIQAEKDLNDAREDLDRTMQEIKEYVGGTEGIRAEDDREAS